MWEEPPSKMIVKVIFESLEVEDCLSDLQSQIDDDENNHWFHFAFC